MTITLVCDCDVTSLLHVHTGTASHTQPPNSTEKDAYRATWRIASLAEREGWRVWVLPKT